MRKKRERYRDWFDLKTKFATTYDYSPMTWTVVLENCNSSPFSTGNRLSAPLGLYSKFCPLVSHNSHDLLSSPSFLLLVSLLRYVHLMWREKHTWRLALCLPYSFILWFSTTTCAVSPAEHQTFSYTILILSHSCEWLWKEKEQKSNSKLCMYSPFPNSISYFLLHNLNFSFYISGYQPQSFTTWKPTGTNRIIA